MQNQHFKNVLLEKSHFIKLERKKNYNISSYPLPTLQKINEVQWEHLIRMMSEVHSFKVKNQVADYTFGKWPGGEK